jgi:hypothetical protein
LVWDLALIVFKGKSKALGTLWFRCNGETRDKSFHFFAQDRKPVPPVAKN